MATTDAQGGVSPHSAISQSGIVLDGEDRPLQAIAPRTLGGWGEEASPVDERVRPGQWAPEAGGVPMPTWGGMWADIQAPQYAGFWRRVIAAIVDGVALAFVAQAVTFGLGAVLPITGDDGAVSDSPWRALGLSIAASIAVSFVVGWLYCAGFESSPWRATPGKRLFRMAVTDLAGDRISFARGSGRYLAEALSSALFLIGYVVQPFTERRQALHDILAGTLVICR